MKIIKEGFEPAKIAKKDISQFSDFKDAYYTVPYMLKNCGLKDVDYSKMGYMLRDEKRKDVADKNMVKTT